MLSSLLQVTQLVRVSARLYLNPSTVYHLTLNLRESPSPPRCSDSLWFLPACGQPLSLAETSPPDFSVDLQLSFLF